MSHTELHPQQPQAQIQPPQPYYYQTPPASDEIDLFELWYVMVKKRVLIFSIAGFAALIAIVYTLVVPPVYLSTITLLPADPINIQGMNIHNTSIDNDSTKLLECNELYTNNCVFEKFIRNFNSGGLQGIFNTTNDSNSRFTITLPKNRAADPTITASLASHDPSSMALLLNNYTQYINDFTTQQIIDEIQLQKQILIAQTERAISSKVKVASQNAANELVQLDEAIALARVLDIKQPKDYLIPLNIPLEFYGYQYLEAKKAFLERRNNSGAFIDGLTDLQEQLLNLNSLSVNSSNFRTIKIDAVASTPSDPIKPKRTLVIVLGILLGLAFGIFAAFFHSAIQSRKEKQATNPN